MKATSVKLVVPALGMEATFEVEHAERLLRLNNNGGWQLPADSEFVFKDDIISKRDKGKGKQGKE